MLQSATTILRILSHLPLTTKGSDLSHEEADNNWIKIYEDLKALMGSNGGTAPAWDSETEYQPGVFVSQPVDNTSGLWEQVSLTPSTGDVPGDDPDIWAERNPSVLSHPAGYDDTLAKGTDNEVSAAQIKAMIGPGVKRFVAKYTQDTTNPPVLFSTGLNTVSATSPTTARVGVGGYTLTYPPGSFTVAQFYSGGGVCLGGTWSCTCGVDDVVTVNTHLHDGASSDDVFLAPSTIWFEILG